MEENEIYFALTIQKPKILKTGTHKGYNYIITSCGIHPCAYVDLPKTHVWYGLHFDDIPIKCHGGITYSEQNGEYWRIGWDYAHANDYCPLYINISGFKIWTLTEIINECINVCEQVSKAKA